MKTISKMNKYSDKVFLDLSFNICKGDYLNEDAILRFVDGLLDGGEQDGEYIPAYEGNTYHLEYFKQGKLHRKHKPAVIGYDDEGYLVREWWEDGLFIKQKREWLDD